jgi:hypothetical protein
MNTASYPLLMLDRYHVARARSRPGDHAVAFELSLWADEIHASRALAQQAAADIAAAHATLRRLARTSAHRRVIERLETAAAALARLTRVALIACGLGLVAYASLTGQNELRRARPRNVLRKDEIDHPPCRHLRKMRENRPPMPRREDFAERSGSATGEARCAVTGWLGCPVEKRTNKIK